MTLPQRAPVAEWRLPEDSPPPRGVKLQLLTLYGVATMGAWSDLDCVAWAPLITIPARIRDRMIEKQKQVAEKNNHA
jgi:hypothetical protein